MLESSLKAPDRGVDGLIEVHGICRDRKTCRVSDAVEVEYGTPTLERSESTFWRVEGPISLIHLFMIERTQLATMHFPIGFRDAMLTNALASHLFSSQKKIAPANNWQGR